MHPAFSTSILPSTDTWALGCIHVWATINDAAINLGVHISFQFIFSFSLVNYLEVELMDYMVALVLTFWETSILFSIVAVPMYIPTAQSFSFLHILQHFLFAVW